MGHQHSHIHDDSAAGRRALWIYGRAEDLAALVADGVHARTDVPTR
jgi:hypothetical protein